MEHKVWELGMSEYHCFQFFLLSPVWWQFYKSNTLDWTHKLAYNSLAYKDQNYTLLLCDKSIKYQLYLIIEKRT